MILTANDSVISQNPLIIYQRTSILSVLVEVSPHKKRA